MGIVYNIIITVAPVAVGVGIGWFISRKGSLVSKSNNTCNNGTPDDQQGQENAETSVKTSSQKPHSLQTNPDSACGNARLPNSKQPNATRQQSHRQTAYPEGNTTVLYERDDNGNIGTQDIEVDSGPITSNLSLVEDAVPATPIACIPPHIETHDAILLYAEEDRPLVKHIQQQLVSNLGTDINDLNIILYEEFAPDVQSHFKTMEHLFCRCRFLFVVVTSNFRKDSLTRYQHEIALTDSIRNPSRNERVIPVWAEAGAQNFLHELSVLKGIDYSRGEVDFRMFRNVFQHGRRTINL